MKATDFPVLLDCLIQRRVSLMEEGKMRLHVLPLILSERSNVSALIGKISPFPFVVVIGFSFHF